MIATMLLAAALAQAGAPAAAPAEKAPAAPPAAAPPAAAPAEKPSRTPAEVAALVAGKIPDDPARAILQARCLICHTGDYVTLQRLTEGQWQKTIEKMKKWGSPISDDEVKALSAWLGRTWNLDLAERNSPRRAAPKGSVPGK